MFIFLISTMSNSAVVVGDNFNLFVKCANGRWAPNKCPSGEEVESATFGPQSSTFAIDNGFDFAETFDGLQVWNGDGSRRGNVGEALDPSDINRMPKLLDGSDSAWGYYSLWGSATPPQPWISDYGDERVWRGTKSAAIDIGETAEGPSRLGFHMGEGYSDFHLFFMVNIPKNEWPTNCPFESNGTTPTPDGSCNNAATGEYVEGEGYNWYSSWKFNTFNLDCDNAVCPDSNTYSDVWRLLTHLKQYNYGSAPGITMHYEGCNDDSQDKWATSSGTNLNNLIGDWFGIEYRVQIVGSTAIFTSWIYDQAGNEVMNADAYTWSMPLSSVGTKWNQFFFGGNNSNTYSWGPTMKSVYYIDDVIVDATRIGPKYFTAIGVAP